ncbi:sugar kinase [Arenicella xantha]|uniref:2-dehydro-3-deoxygluconokinase n=1 Tax=Arenicella xantha TaxID=644221 RepID=A0A395JNS2_9GAMM|nr:sugar kinase [Arenicella xantha]RBP49724.1 2-keto-3-deoxygluconate kinase [Arenicella xantha]
MSVSVSVIGECMLELSRADFASRGNPQPMMMSYGGDTLNTSIYLARNGIATSYVTALGDDIMSDWLLQQWQDEGVDCSLVRRMPNSVPGMYMIDVAEDGERSFLYWRKNSPASQLFDDIDQTTKLFQALNNSDYLYLSGISLGILPEQSLHGLFGYLRAFREAGGKIIFDGNYRPSLWLNVETAQQVYTQMYAITDVALPTLEDESLLFGYETAEQLVDVISAAGVSEIVVKMGSAGCLSVCDRVHEYVAAVVTKPVDTTAAGDSFNAGYLSARLTGSSAVDACAAGHALASKVIQHKGAIIPKG